MKEPDNNLQGLKLFVLSLLLLNVIMCFFFEVVGEKDSKEKAESIKVRKQGNTPEGYNMTSNLTQ